MAPNAPVTLVDPVPLWALAVEAARGYGVHATARRLHLDYYSLKQQVEAAGDAGAPDTRPARSAFVEVVRASAGGVRTRVSSYAA